MNIRSLSILSLVCMVLSCGSPDKEYVVKVRLLHLSDSTLYDRNMVYDVLFDAEENNIDSLKVESRGLFLKGIDQYRNKHNPKKAIELFKSSVLVFPDAKTYYELGNALLDSGNGYESAAEAIKAFKVAEHLRFQPISAIYYKEACASNLLSQYNNSEEGENYKFHTFDYLRAAFSNGFSDTTALKKDLRLQSIVNTREYQRLVLEAFLSRDPGSSPFGLFKKSFPLSAGTFEIPISKVTMEGHNESVSYDFSQFIPEMENTSFGRDVSHDFFYVAKISETSAYTALVYTSVNFEGEAMQPVYTTLATYTANGEIISKKLISCQCSAENIKTASIENNKILIRDYKRIWEYPIDEVPFEKNRIKDHHVTAEATFKIDDSGRIVDDEVPHNYDDSSVVAVIR